jgi:hypothetical protein
MQSGFAPSQIGRRVLVHEIIARCGPPRGNNVMRASALRSVLLVAPLMLAGAALRYMAAARNALTDWVN